MIGVFETKFGRGYAGPESFEEYAPFNFDCDFVEAYLLEYETDAHCVMYRSKLDPDGRVRKAFAEEAGVEIVQLLFDFDLVEGAWPSEEDAYAARDRLKRTRIGRFAKIVHLTRKGLHLAIELARPISPDRAQGILEACAEQLEEDGFKPDPGGLRWEQPFRMPRVVRDDGDDYRTKFYGDEDSIEVDSDLDPVDPDGLPFKTPKTRANFERFGFDPLEVEIPARVRDEAARYARGALRKACDLIENPKAAKQDREAHRKNAYFEAGTICGNFAILGLLTEDDCRIECLSALHNAKDPHPEGVFWSHWDNGFAVGLQNPRDLSALVEKWEEEAEVAFSDRYTPEGLCEALHKLSPVRWDPDAKIAYRAAPHGLWRRGKGLLDYEITGTLREALEARIVDLEAEFNRLPEESEAKKWAERCLNQAKDARKALARPKGVSDIRGMVQSTEEFAWPGAGDHKNPNMILTASGVVDLRTGKLESAEASRDLYLTKQAHPDARLVDWKRDDRLVRFLNSAFDDEAEREFVQMIAGMGVIGRSFPYFVIAYGATRSGKSTITRALENCLGDYGTVESSQIFQASSNDRERLEANARFPGMRFVAAEELKWEKLDNDYIKSLCDESGKIPHRGSYAIRGVTDFDGLVVVTTNHIPEIEWERAIAERLVVLNFRHTHEEADGRTVGAGGLKTYLTETPEGISAFFSWAVEGASKVIANGYKLPEFPAGFAEALEKIRGENDRLGDHVVNLLAESEGDEVSLADLREAIRRGCNSRRERMPSEAESDKSFVRYLKRHTGWAPTRVSRGDKKQWIIKGSKLKPWSAEPKIVNFEDRRSRA